ncbi:MAG: tripartite tricarboxylate transporter substrate binding protein [Xanthobacteraceae bacterium]|nr:tripartite tricarboxylate transporter substrate binding protein [Xanthobacteraceae bacterium]
MLKWIGVWSALLSIGGAAVAQAPTYPSRPVTIVVTAAAGGVSDVIARAVGQRLSALWKQQVIIENRGGAAHTIGAAAVAKATPDGHTLMIAESGTFVTNPLLYDKGKLPFDVEKEIAPITGLVRINHALAVHPGLPVANFRELIELGRQKPGEIPYATTGIGAATHLNVARLESMAGAKFLAVHYRGAAPAFSDVVAGHVKFMLISMSTTIQPFQQGQIKLLGIGGLQRLPQFPSIPTLAEALPGYRAGTWFGLATTGGTPNDIVMKVNQEVTQILADPEFRAKFLEPQLFESMVSLPDRFAEDIRAERETWRSIISKAKIRIE